MSDRTLAIARIEGLFCSYCQAKPRQACITATGGYRAVPHMLRYYAALRDGLLPMHLQDAFFSRSESIP